MQLYSSIGYTIDTWGTLLRMYIGTRQSSVWQDRRTRESYQEDMADQREETVLAYS